MITQHISRTVHINAPIENVFSALIDWQNQSKWIFATKVKAMKNDGKGIGGTILARTAIGPFGFNDPMTITKWQPPYRCDVLHTGCVVKGTGAFIVEAISSDVSIFTWAEETIVPLGVFGRIGWQVVKFPAGSALSWSLRRFKKWVESSSL